MCRYELCWNYIWILTHFVIINQAKTGNRSMFTLIRNSKYPHLSPSSAISISLKDVWRPTPPLHLRKGLTRLLLTYLNRHFSVILWSLPSCKYDNCGRKICVGWLVLDLLLNRLFIVLVITFRRNFGKQGSNQSKNYECCSDNNF